MSSCMNLLGFSNVSWNRCSTACTTCSQCLQTLAITANRRTVFKLAAMETAPRTVSVPEKVGPEFDEPIAQSWWKESKSPPPVDRVSIPSDTASWLSKMVHDFIHQGWIIVVSELVASPNLLLSHINRSFSMLFCSSWQQNRFARHIFDEYTFCIWCSLL